MSPGAPGSRAASASAASRTSSPSGPNGSTLTASSSRRQTPAITPSTSSTGENQPPVRYTRSRSSGASAAVSSRGVPTTYWSNAGGSRTTPDGAAASSPSTCSASVHARRPSTSTSTASAAFSQRPAWGADGVPNQRARSSRVAGP